jgi:hypothetical protein
MPHRWSLFLFILIAVAACGQGAATRMPRAAPNPNGCYVILYARAQFVGQVDLLDGPVRLGTLDHLSQTTNENWKHRIRSLRVGRAATLKAYTGPEFEGDVQQFAAGTQHPSLDQRFSARIESLDLTCDQP